MSSSQQTINTYKQKLIQALEQLQLEHTDPVLDPLNQITKQFLNNLQSFHYTPALDHNVHHNNHDDDHLSVPNENDLNKANAPHKTSSNELVAPKPMKPNALSHDISRSPSPYYFKPLTDPNQRHPIRAYIDGCYDITHSGHFNAIRQAKTLCDILIVGVHTDEEIAHHKGPVVMHGEERVACVRACKWVDDVAYGTPYVPTVALLDELNCDFCIHGDDESTSASGEDAFAAVKKQGRMRIVKRTEGVSTTNLVGRILLAERIEKQRNEKNNTSSDSYDDDAISTQTISSFLATTYRINQFSSHRRPKKDDRVVYVNGDFDLFHAGHIELLKKAHEMGDFVYVGIWSDAECSRLYGSAYPVMGLFERAFCVLGNQYVDDIVLGVQCGVTEDLIRTLNVHIVVDASSCHPIPATFAAAAYKDILSHKKKDDKMEKSSTIDTKNHLDSENSTSTFLNYVFATAHEKDVLKSIPMDSNSSSSLSKLTTGDIVDRVGEHRKQYENRNAKRAKKERDYFDNKVYVEEN